METLEKKLSTYVVFNEQPSGALHRIGAIEAKNDVDAIDLVLGDPNSAGKYVAIAQRNFRIRTVGVQTNPKRTIT